MIHLCCHSQFHAFCFTCSFLTFVHFFSFLFFLFFRNKKIYYLSSWADILQTFRLSLITFSFYFLLQLLLLWMHVYFQNIDTKMKNLSGYPCRMDIVFYLKLNIESAKRTIRWINCQKSCSLIPSKTSRLFLLYTSIYLHIKVSQNLSLFDYFWI